MELGVRQSQIIDPEKSMAAHFHGKTQHRIQPEENRDLQKHRQAAADRIDTVLFIKTHDLRVHFLRVILEFFLQFLHLRGQQRHAFHLAGRLQVQWPENTADQNGE